MQSTTTVASEQHDKFVMAGSAHASVDFADLMNGSGGGGGWDEDDFSKSFDASTSKLKYVDCCLLFSENWPCNE